MESKVNETMEQSFADRRFIKLYFVLEDGQEKKDVTELFSKAFEISEEKLIGPEWIKASELKKQTLTKKILCVLQKFEGHLFDELRAANCLILGPLCILGCLMKGEPTPNGPNPVFSLAMQGITVCVSGLPNTQKVALKEKVEFMGGRFQRSLTLDVTHLVSNQSTSEKYNVAAKRKLPVMQEQWVHETWAQCQMKNVHAEDPPLLSLRCPTFQALRVCASQIARQKKEHIKKMIETQGGVYCTNLSDKDTDVLVAGGGQSEKVMAAKQWKIPCVREQWVEDSFNAGYALNYNDYEITVDRCSTPDKDKTFVDANFSMMSVISSTSSAAHVINETIMNETTFAEPEPKKSRGQSVASATNKAHLRTPEKSSKTAGTSEAVLREIEALEAKDIKKAGSFLDGCKVYLSGFTSSVLDKVRKILNFGGATRFDQITEGVSHVLVAGSGLSAEEQRAAMQFQPHVVSAAWLLASLKQGHQANIEPYLCYESQQSTEPSPLSKKGLAMWKKSPVGVTKNLTAQSDLHLVKQYIQFDPTSPDKTQSERTQMESTCSVARVEEREEEEELAQPLNDEETEVTSTGMFSGLKFWCLGFDDEIIESIQTYVKSCGAKWSQNHADYTVVPLAGTNKETSGQLVNQNWIEECAEREELIPVAYYHKPVQVKVDTKPLSNCVLAISSYTGIERNYLSTLAIALGALFQEVFAKKRNPERNAEASTHLLCPTPTGSKYQAAVKWKLPVVTAEWLLACAEQGAHVPEEPYLLAGSTMVRNTSDQSTGSDVTITGNVTVCNNQTPVQVNNTATYDHTGKPLSAIPSRLRTPVSESKVCEPPPQDTNVTPVNDKTLPHQFVTPASAKKTPSADTYTPLTSRTPSQQYTPYTPAPIPKEDKAKNETPVVATPGVDMATVTPRTYNNYWARKVPMDQPTPETPYGNAFVDNPSPNTRKEWKQFLNYVTGEETPLGRKRGRDQVNAPSPTEEAKKHKQEDQQATKQPCNNIVENEHVFKTPGPSSPHIDQSINIVPSSVNRTILSNTRVTEEKEQEVEESVHEKENHVKYKFMLTGFDESLRESIEEVVVRLGGEMSSLVCFDPSATHLVMNRPMRSEKLLASIAAGKWIVHHSFITESCKRNTFLTEENFEWGNPRAEGLKSFTPNKLAESLASACYRWRSKLQTSDCKGAFVGFNAILLTQQNKFQAFSRLIKAGGGETLDLEPPFSDPSDATHCFVEESKMALIDKAALESKNVVIVPPIYLNDFLLREISPQEWLESNKASTRTPRH